MCSSDADISGIWCVWQESIPSSQPESHGLHLFHLSGKVMTWRGGSFGGIGIRTDPGPRGGVKPMKRSTSRSTMLMKHMQLSICFMTGSERGTAV